MSNHSVLLRKVSHIVDHPNADKLEIVKLDGLNYTIISQKGNYKIGEYALFIPDSMILPKEMIEYFELTFLKNNVVKPTKLRGIVSQALILPFGEVYKYSESFRELLSVFEATSDFDYDYSGVLGITRKEDVILTNDGKTKGNLPDTVEKYDLENIERYPEMFDKLYDEIVVVTEKLEGTNFAVHAFVNNEGVIETQFCSRNLIKEGGLYQEIPQKQGIQEFAINLLKELKCNSVTVRGEIVGQSIQGNIYQLNTQECYVFDIKVDGDYIEPSFVNLYCGFHDVKTVPVLYSGKLRNYCNSIDDLKEISNGGSVLNPKHLREGIVIEKFTHGGIGRVIFKQRSPDYLSL